VVSSIANFRHLCSERLRSDRPSEEGHDQLSGALTSTAAIQPGPAYALACVAHFRAAIAGERLQADRPSNAALA